MIPSNIETSLKHGWVETIESMARELDVDDSEIGIDLKLLGFEMFEFKK
jgi:hypothetical protein